MPPQMLRASSHRAYEVFVLNTSNSDNAKAVELKGAVSSNVMPGMPAGNRLNCSALLKNWSAQLTQMLDGFLISSFLERH